MSKDSPSVPPPPIRIVITKHARLRFQESPVDYPLRISLYRDEIPDWKEIRRVISKD
jgi:hypothetical protein